MSQQRPIGIKKCSLSLPAITKVFLYFFEEIEGYLYEGDDLNTITNYSALILPTPYYPTEKNSLYQGTKKEGLFHSWEHNLKMFFPKMEAYKRGEFMKLESRELTVIFEDKNGQAWIMGQHEPARISKIDTTTAGEGGANEYEVVITSIEKQLIRKIISPSDGCFTSFFGREFIQSEIEVKQASLLPWVSLNGSSNSTPISYTATPPLNPVGWTTNTNSSAPTNELNQLISFFSSGGGNVRNATAQYISSGLFGDTVRIRIDSLNSGFGGLVVDGQKQDPSSVIVFINITLVLNPAIALPTTIIDIEDESGLLYSGSYGDPITGVVGISGTTDNAIIFATQLYPNGQKITAKVRGFSCGENSYTYDYKNTLQPCETQREYQFWKGEKVKIKAYTNEEDGAPRFQNMEFNIFGYVFNMYFLFSEWHSNFIQFKADFLAAILRTRASVDLNSFSFNDKGNFIKIEFLFTGMNIQQENPYLKPYSRIEATSKPNYLLGWNQSRVLQIETVAPLSSTVELEDEFGKKANGLNLVSLARNGFQEANSPSPSNFSIDNISIFWAFDENLPYGELSKIKTSAISDTCFAPEMEGSFPACYDGFNSTESAYYYVLLVSVDPIAPNLGSSFEIELSDGTSFRANTPSQVTTNSGGECLCNLINTQKGNRVLHYEYSAVEFVYRIGVTAKIGLRFVSKITETTNGRSFNGSSLSTVYTNQLTQNVNPYTTINWTLPAVGSPAPTGDKNLTIGNWEEKTTNIEAISLYWDSQADKLTISRISNVPEFVQSRLNVFIYENYPTPTAASLGGFLLSGGSNSLDTNNASQVVDASKAKFALYVNSVGWGYVLPFDMSEGSKTVTFKEQSRKPTYWGTVDSINYIGLQKTSSEPIVKSLHPDCLGESIEPEEGDGQQEQGGGVIL